MLDSSVEEIFVIILNGEMTSDLLSVFRFCAGFHFNKPYPLGSTILNYIGRLSAFI